MDNDTNTATESPVEEPTLADLQAQLKDIQEKLNQPIQTTTVNDAFKKGFILWLIAGLIALFFIVPIAIIVI